MYHYEWDDSIFISTELITDCYSHYDKNANRYRPIQTQKIAKTLENICPSAENKRRSYEGKQKWGYILPSIQLARTEFESAIKTQINWNNETPENIEPDYEEEPDPDLLRDAMRELASETI